MCSSFNTKICKINDNSLKNAKTLLLNEQLVAFPTETVYGLGALATSDLAVKRIFEAKGRPSDNPLIVHVHKDFDVSSLVYVDFDYVNKLRKAFLPGPLTMVYRSKQTVSSLVSCGLNTLAVRIPSSPYAQEFLKYVNLPIAAPSANVSKHTSPVTAEHVFDDLKGKIDLILDGGKCSGGIESTVLDVTNEIPIILRSGLVTRDMIKAVVGKCEYADQTQNKEVRSPGCKYQHYTPKCPTALFERTDIASAQELYDKLELLGETPYFLCDNVICNKLCGRALLLGGTGEEIASNLYYKLLEGEKIAGFIIGISVKTGDDIDVGIMNRMSKACTSQNYNK